MCQSPHKSSKKKNWKWKKIGSSFVSYSGGGCGGKKKSEAIFILEYFYLFLSFFKSLNSIFLSLDNLLGPTWTSRQERIPRKSTLINRIVCFYHFIFFLIYFKHSLTTYFSTPATRETKTYTKHTKYTHTHTKERKSPGDVVPTDKLNPFFNEFLIFFLLYKSLKKQKYEPGQPKTIFF